MSFPDFIAGGSVDYKFATLAIAGTVAALTGGSVVVYKNNGTVESSTGVTLTADFDSRTGLNHVGINLAADGSFYSAGANFQVILATGTANSVSLNNYPLFHFTVEAQNHKPTGGTVATVSGNVAGNVTGNIGGSVTGGVLSAGTVTNPILVRGGTVDVAGTVTNAILVRGGTVALVSFVDGLTSAGDLAVRSAVDSALGAYSLGAGVMPIGGVAGTVSNPILVRGGTVAVATSAGTVTNSITVYAGTVNVAGTVTNPLSVYAGTVDVATALGNTALVSVGTAIYDLAAGIETGLTFRQWARLLRAVMFGVSNATDNEAGTIVFMRKDGTTAAGTAVYNAEGDRTSTTEGSL